MLQSHLKMLSPSRTISYIYDANFGLSKYLFKKQQSWQPGFNSTF